MNLIWKSFLGLFFLLLVTVCGAGILQISMQAKCANQFLGDAITVIEQSNFSESVIRDVTSQAKEAGYELAVAPKTTNAHTSYAKMSLSYSYQIPVLQNDVTKKTLIGYAR